MTLETTSGAERLAAFSWPGNVRELDHVLERWLVQGTFPPQMGGETSAEDPLAAQVKEAVARHAGKKSAARLADAPRLVANYGEGTWVKMQTVVRGLEGNITVHWFRNLSTLQNVEYKFAYVAPAYR